MPTNKAQGKANMNNLKGLSNKQDELYKNKYTYNKSDGTWNPPQGGAKMGSIEAAHQHLKSRGPH